MVIDLNDKLYRNVKVYFLGKVTLKTALHIGTGTGDHHTDSTVMKDSQGNPFIPGSSMKGVLRSISESLCEVIMNEKACFLHQDSGVECITAQKDLVSKYNELLEAKKSSEAKKWLDDKRCLPCKLFGSPLVASKISIADLQLVKTTSKKLDIRVRDGVGIDRDTETARDGVKFDFETVSPEAQFSFEAIVDKPCKKEAQLLAIGIRELELGNAFLGGNTSRGLGRFKLEIENIRYLPYTKDALINYLLCSDPSSDDPFKYAPKIENPKAAIDQLIAECLAPEGGKQNA
jgi:CRISPR-associated protein Csm3